MSDPPLLALEGFGVAFGGQPVLADVDLTLGRTGLLVLIGPSGSGKSTLVRTLAGLNDAHPSLTSWGTATIDGQPLLPRSPHPRDRRTIGLAVQHSRFFLSTVRENLVSALPDRSRLDRAAQNRKVLDLLDRCGLGRLADRLEDEVVGLPQPLQRMLAIARATAGNPLLVMADEPTSGLDDDSSVQLIALLRDLASSLAVVLITHNQRHARLAGGSTALLAGGRIVEHVRTSQFFAGPLTEAGRSFLATGGCVMSQPGAEGEALADSLPPPPPLSQAARAAVRDAKVHPRGFFWVLPGRLGGLPRPGIIAELEEDLLGLRRMGVTLLITLEETRVVDALALAAVGVASVHFPIPDMGAPETGPTLELCALVDRRMAAGEVVAFHCRAGLGRTGTLLACQLVWAGETAIGAIERVRQITPRCIQSDAQAAFIESFENALPPRAPRASQFPESIVSTA